MIMLYLLLCMPYYSFNPVVVIAVNPVGTSYSNIPILLAFEPALDTAVVPKYPFPKFQFPVIPLPSTEPVTMKGVCAK